MVDLEALQSKILVMIIDIYRYVGYLHKLVGTVHEMVG